MIQSKDNTYIIIAVYIFFTGLWFPKIGIPLLGLLLVFLIIKHRQRYIAFTFLFQYIIITLFILSYIVFWNDPQIPASYSYFKNKELYMLIQLLIVISSVYWITIFIFTKKKLIKLLYLFSFGMFIKSLSITLYTLIYAPYLLEFRQLLDPFSMKISNSPGISLLAVYCTISSLYFLFISTKKTFLFHLFIVLLGLLIGILLQARTFFVIFNFVLIYILIINFSLKNVVKYFLIIPILIFSLSFLNDYMLKNNDYYYSTQVNTLNRFQNEGVNSNRYQQWSSALDIIANNPLGGGSTDRSIEKTYWFHNLWLDIGRTSGLLPILFILITQGYTLFLVIKNLYTNPSLDKHFLFILYIALLIGLFVEIALEGNMVLFVFHIFFMSVVFRYYQINLRKE